METARRGATPSGLWRIVETVLTCRSNQGLIEDDAVLGVQAFRKVKCDEQFHRAGSVFAECLSLAPSRQATVDSGAGMRFQLEPNNLNAPDEEILADLRRVSADHPAPHLSWHTYGQHGRFGAETVRRRFGSWNVALAKAGLTAGKRWRISDDELFANLESIWRTLGRQPRRADFDAVPTAVSKSVYEQRFGSWRAALEAFVAWANSASETDHTAITPVQDRGRRTTREPSLRLRFRVMRRDGFKCAQCGRSPATEAGVILHIDHVLAWAVGGETVYENLQTLCDRCNLGKSCLPAGGV